MLILSGKVKGEMEGQRAAEQGMIGNPGTNNVWPRGGTPPLQKRVSFFETLLIDQADPRRATIDPGGWDG